MRYDSTGEDPEPGCGESCADRSEHERGSEGDVLIGYELGCLDREGREGGEGADDAYGQECPRVPRRWKSFDEHDEHETEYERSRSVDGQGRGGKPTRVNGKRTADPVARQVADRAARGDRRQDVDAVVGPPPRRRTHPTGTRVGINRKAGAIFGRDPPGVRRTRPRTTAQRGRAVHGVQTSRLGRTGRATGRAGSQCRRRRPMLCRVPCPGAAAAVPSAPFGTARRCDV